MMRGDHRGADGGGLLRAARYHHAGQIGVGVVEIDGIHGQAQPFGGNLGLGCGCAHAHFVRGNADDGATGAGQRDPRRAAGHAVVRIAAGGDPHADLPIAVAPGARQPARIPPEPLTADFPGLHDAALRERQARTANAW